MSGRISARLFAVSLLFLSAGFCARESLAQGPEVMAAQQLFLQGNSAYKEGRYDAAIENYEKVLMLGLESGSLYYNLGGSYFKAGEGGKAILNYEKALFLIPGDSDLRSNYEHVLSSLDLSPQVSGNWLEKSANLIFGGLTIDSLAILLSAVYSAVILVFLCGLLIAGFWKSGKIILTALAALFILSAVSLNSKINLFNNGAVVVASAADVRFEPLEGATVYFRLTEGSKVGITERGESWYKIRRADGLAGWVEKTALGVIFDLIK